MLKEAFICLKKFVNNFDESFEYLEISPNTYCIKFNKNLGIFKIRIENKRNNRRSLMQNEAQTLRILETSNLDIQYPRLITLEQATTGNLFSLQSYISGETVAKINSRKKKYKYYKEIGNYLKAIHSIHNSQCGRLINLQNISWRDNFMNHFISDANEAKNIISKKLLKDINSKATKMLEFITTKPQLLHGDPHPGNMIISNDYIAMIDFQHSLFGDPLFEVAQFYVRMTRYEKKPEAAMKALLNGMKIKKINLNIIYIYILALFINEISFSARMKKKESTTFYTQKFLTFYKQKGKNI